MRRERTLTGARRRVLQLVALYAPGADSVRVRLHRWRGVRIGEQVFIGTDTLIETAHPQLVAIGSGVDIGARVTIIAHQQGESVPPTPTVTIEDDVFVGPGSLILPHVTIGRGAVVSAGSVVTKSVPALTMVGGNPAAPVARCGVALGRATALSDFYAKLRPVRRP
jgi:acetyltransferase-like isoleucine patch superfamily enzyme